MLLFPFPFGSRLAVVPRTSLQVLADCVGDLIMRDMAHVASTGDTTEYAAVVASKYYICIVVYQ